MPIPGLELETSGFDTMLGFMHQPCEPKSLSDWEEEGNPLILHNSANTSKQGEMADIAHAGRFHGVAPSQLVRPCIGMHTYLIGAVGSSNAATA
jgi:hypothetical protein